MTEGRLVLMGSGELAPGLVATHRHAAEAAGAVSVTIVDSPYGFQENADDLTARIEEFFDVSLGLPGEVATLRSAEEDPLAIERAVAAVRRARYLFAGPGSPTHALRVWGGTGFADAVAEVILDGGSACFASAASLAVGTRAMPVYQIYKVGDPPHWHPGLGITDRLGLPMAIVPHWNNAEGGTHDTSRCYVGLRRLAVMARVLDHGILGIDEHTAVTLDFGARTATVTGLGGISIIGPHGAGLGDGEARVESGSVIGLDQLAHGLGAGVVAEVSAPAEAETSKDLRSSLAAGDAEGVVAALLELDAATRGHAGSALRSAIVELLAPLRRGLIPRREVVAPFVDLILETRASLRASGSFDAADRLRDALVDLGLEINDGPDGTTWVDPGRT